MTEPHKHERCQCSPNCQDCIYCDAKFTIGVINGKPAWLVPEAVSKRIH